MFIRSSTLMVVMSGASCAASPHTLVVTKTATRAVTSMRLAVAQLPAACQSRFVLCWDKFFIFVFTANSLI